MSIMKRSLLAVLGISCAVVVGCGDQQDKRLSNADVACLKLIQAGMPCAPGGVTAVNTTTVTSTSTVTTTSTSTVTVTGTN